LENIMPFKRVLCAVDFSRDSLEAFGSATDIARLHSGALLLFHVIEAQPAVPVDVTLDILNKANIAMEGLVASAQSSLEGITFTSSIATGLAFREIVDRAREWRSDLVVLGAKGHSLLEETVVGGTAEAVLKEAPCSVLVVRRQ
jgi:nucleotide-binding universal stress UspA family protein